MIEVSENSMIEFTKLLLELSGTYEVLTDRTVLALDDNKPVALKVAGNIEAPLKVFKEGDPREGYAYLHPFKESCTNTNARGWFYHVCCVSVQVLLKKLLIKSVELAAKRSPDNTDQLEVLSKIFGKADETMISEMEKISINDLIMIYYNKKEKKATLSAFYFAQETRDKYPKFRKKTWEVIETLVEIFLDEENIEPSEILSYTATLINIPETEAKLQVIISTIMRMSPYLKLLLNKDVHAEELAEHLKLLNGYNKLHLYLNADNTYPISNNTQQQPLVNPIGKPLLQYQQPLVQAPPADTGPKVTKPNKVPDAIPRATVDADRLTPHYKPKLPPMMPQPGYPQQMVQQQPWNPGYQQAPPMGYQQYNAAPPIMQRAQMGYRPIQSVYGGQVQQPQYYGNYGNQYPQQSVYSNPNQQYY